MGEGGDNRLPDNLTAAIVEAVRSEVGKLFNVEIGRVVSYDAATQKAKIQPVIRRYFQKDGQAVAQKIPQLVSVPVQFPVLGDFVVVGPLKPGNTGILLFTDRSIEEWKNQGGGDVTPQARRKNSPTDAVFVPGLSPFNAAIQQASATDLVIGEDGDGSSPLKQIRIGPGGVTVTDGTLSMKLLSNGIELGSPGADVLDILSDLMTTLQTTIPLVDAVTGNKFFDLTALLIKIASIKT